MSVMRFKAKLIEDMIIRIEATIANALELSQKAKTCVENSEALLIRAQQDLEEMYLILDGQTSIEE